MNALRHNISELVSNMYLVILTSRPTTTNIITTTTVTYYFVANIIFSGELLCYNKQNDHFQFSHRKKKLKNRNLMQDGVTSLPLQQS